MNTWLSYYTRLLVATTFLLIVAGGLVTSTESGLAVPDWPLSYGQLMPPMVGGIFYEHSHRMIASLVGLMTLILTLWIGFSEKRRLVRWIGIGALAMVVAQGVLGGMTVLFLLPAPISIFHACLAQTFFGVVVLLAYLTSREWFSPIQPAKADLNTLKKLIWITITLIYMQLVLGATVRHTHNPYVIIPHIAGAFLVLLMSGSVLSYILRNLVQERKLLKPATLLAFLSLGQIAIGMFSFIYTMVLPPTSLDVSSKHVLFVTAHQSLGALVLAVSVFLMLRVYRMSRVCP